MTSMSCPRPKATRFHKPGIRKAIGIDIFHEVNKAREKEKEKTLMSCQQGISIHLHVLRSSWTLEHQEKTGRRTDGQRDRQTSRQAGRQTRTTAKAPRQQSAQQERTKHASKENKAREQNHSTTPHKHRRQKTEEKAGRQAGRRTE